MIAFRKDEQISLEDYVKEIYKNKASPDYVERVIKLVKERDELKKEEKRQRALNKARLEAEKKAKAQKEEDERIEQITSMDLPLDYENAFFGDERAKGLNVETVSDGLVTSLNVLGKVDIEYIAQVCNKTCREVIEELRGSIYQNPLTWNECFYKGWETADEYLSGNLYKKWGDANAANLKYKGWFDENLSAIEEILPKGVAKNEVYVTLGSPWVPTKIIDDFIDYLLGRSYASGKVKYAVKHDEVTGTWDIPEKSRYYNNSKAYSTFGTRRIPALYLLEKILNMRSVAVYDEIPCDINKSGKARIINQEETAEALEKKKKLIELFKKWVWNDKKRSDLLEEAYQEKYAYYRVRRYDGRFLTFPEMNKSITLRPYQKNSVARIVLSPNTLLAHEVGSGKTFIMISAGMELRRMGISKKNLYVVPNNLVGQWEKMFHTLYPSAKIMVVKSKDFIPVNRQKTLEKIKNVDCDGILMASSSFDLIPLSADFYEKKLQERKELLDSLEAQIGKSTSGVKAEKKKIQKQLYELRSSSIASPLDGVAFDELGITRLFVDEAHNYKNLYVETKATNVLGLSSSKSKKCSDMLDKVRCVQGVGGGVIMATGTPITNSITDTFVMQYYLQYGELNLLDLQNFDSWIGMFAEQQSEFEVDVDTSKYRMATRFSKFHNLPELTAILSSIADFHQNDSSSEIPSTDGYTDSLIAKTPEFNKYLEKISERADKVRNKQVKLKEDNMLKITTDGRKGALDLRLVDDKAQFTYQSKVARCAENVANIYYRTLKNKSTQLIFCDTSTPKAGFNVYSELRRLLTAMGVLDGEIAFVHDADSDAKRNKLFDKVNSGEIRVLIGSTAKLGLGVNVQKKLIAVHHLDVPWRPADMVQREGRILRPHNENSKVEIHRYVTEGSFDAYSWQLLESKQRFISAILSGSLKERSGSDVSDTTLNYAEVKALAIGNPLIKKRVEVSNELSRLYTLQRKLAESKDLLEQELNDMPDKIFRQKRLVKNCESDVEYLKGISLETTKEEKLELCKAVFEAVSQNANKDEETNLLSYKGFSVILPKNMLADKPYIYLQKTGRYYVEIGKAEKGVSIRIDNALKDLPDRLVRLQDGFTQLCSNRDNILEELEKDYGYDEKIEKTLQELEKIDKKLGVNKNGKN